MAAPALAASSADWAICAGVTGTAGLRPGVSADPVTAQEIMTLRCIVFSPCSSSSRGAHSHVTSSPRAGPVQNAGTLERAGHIHVTAARLATLCALR